MKTKYRREIDILSAGELLIDFISRDFTDNLDEATTFEKIQGGSPANLCMNMGRLANRAMLVATVGNDDMGRFLYNTVRELGVDCRHIRRVEVPTTLILVTRSKEVSNFEAYRSADCRIADSQFPEEVLAQCSIFHTTCFGLSLPPARSSILKAARIGYRQECQLSIDVNYAAKIWKDQREAQQIVAEYCGMEAIVKVSEVDWERLYGHKFQNPEEPARHFLNLGAAEVCVTMGSKGCYVADDEQGHFLPSRKVDVKDTTGAGDAFWSGYLTAWLDGKSLLERAIAGRRMAEIKLSHFGALPGQIKKERIYEDIE